MSYLLADTGFWYAVFDPRDPYHPAARPKVERLKFHRVVLPWPTMYETLGTRFVRNTPVLARFERFLKSSNVQFLDDAPFRDDAFQLAFDSSLRQRRPLSFVDCLIRIVLERTDVRVDYLATFNERDFRDVCGQKGIRIY